MDYDYIFMITLTTDFGMGTYVAQIKGAILSLNPRATVIDISHEITRHNVLEGAYVLFSSASAFPSATHLAVVDPGVGTERRGLIVACKKGALVGPDNGLLMPAAKKLGLTAVYEISNKNYFANAVSDTFHGRDVFAPVAAHLDQGVKPKEIGEVTASFVDLDFGECAVDADTFSGKIIFIDRFGNAITNIPGEKITQRFAPNDTMTLAIGKKQRRVRFVRSYGYADKGELIALISSSGFLELAKNLGSGANALKAKIGDALTIH